MKQKNTSKRASRKVGLFDPQSQVDYLVKLIDLGVKGEELRVEIKRIVEYSHAMGQYKGSLEVRGEWLEYLEKKIERNL
jgi:hypothetical protein